MTRRDRLTARAESRSGEPRAPAGRGGPPPIESTGRPPFEFLAGAHDLVFVVCSKAGDEATVFCEDQRIRDEIAAWPAPDDVVRREAVNDVDVRRFVTMAGARSRHAAGESSLWRARPERKGVGSSDGLGWWLRE